MGKPLYGLDKELLAAVQANDTEQAILCLNAGANPYACNEQNSDVITSAAAHGNVGILRALKNNGVDLADDSKTGGWTPLHAACMNNRYEAVDFLLQFYSREDLKRGMVGKTPLHFAVAKGSARLIKRLAEAGAPLDAEEYNGATPLSRAIEYANPEAVQGLLEAGADPGNQLHAALVEAALFDMISANNEKDAEGAGVISLLNKAGLSMNITAGRDITNVRFGDSLLYHALKCRRYAAARAILQGEGADVHGVSHAGKSAMHHCLDLRLKEGVEMLLDRGFDADRVFDYTRGPDDNGDPRRHSSSAKDHAMELVRNLTHPAYREMLQMIEAAEEARAEAAQQERARLNQVTARIKARTPRFRISP